MTYLEGLILLPLFLAAYVAVVPKKHVVHMKVVALYGFFAIFICTLLLWTKFDSGVVGFQFSSERELLSSLNLYYSIGIDGISLFLVILTGLLFPLCLLCSWTTITYRIKEYILVLCVLEFMLFNVFVVLDLLLFYVFFESVLIPMFLIIGVWGSRERRIHAAYQFFFYTLLGSLLMLLAILLVYFEAGTTNLHGLLTTEFSRNRELLIWFAFFFSFAVKVPMVPVHIWLPEAHVEAPTAGSVILAGILLKMGTYGLIRFSLPMMPMGTMYFAPLVYMLSIVSIIYSSCTTIRQVDLKKIIAYSSVAHMNFVTIGIMCHNIAGIEGSIYMMLGHGVVSSALFLCVGGLYERYHTRVISYYGGLIYGMPIFGIIFLIFTLANISFPGTSNFVGEFLILLGTCGRSFVVVFLASIGVILGAVYAIWLYNRVMFGEVKGDALTKFCDVNRREFWTYLPLVVMVFVMGISPSLVLETMHVSVGEVLSYRWQ
jgi:proton-translocating NADH-quinone oxidoreductase chain M